MARARIDYHEAADRVTFGYRPAFNLFALPILLWSISGGLAVGVGLAVGLVAAGVLSIQAGPQDFQIALIAGAVGGALLLFLLGVILGLRRRVLRIAFDYARQILVIRQPDQRRALRVGFGRAVAFRLVESGSKRCTLLLEVDDAPEYAIITTSGSCHDERTRLPQLTGRLNAHLDALRTIPDEIPEVAADVD